MTTATVNMFDIIKGLKPVYIIFIVLGILSAIGLHFINKKKYEKFWLVTVIYVISLILSLLLSMSLIMLINKQIISKHNNNYVLTNFSFINTMMFFVLIVMMFSVIFSLDLEKIKQPMVACLMVFLIFAKLGCTFNGCCTSRTFENGFVMHLNLYESIFAILLLALYYLKKYNIFNMFFVIYLPYRFITEFVRDSYKKQIIIGSIFTATQLFALISLIVIILYIVLAKKKTK